MSRPLGQYRKVRRTMVEFAKVAFTDHETWPYVDGNPEKSAVLILDSWASNEETPQKKPRIVVARGGFSMAAPVIGPYLTGPPMDEGVDRHYLRFNMGNFSFNCVSNNDLVCDDLADELEKFLFAAKEDFKRRGILIDRIAVHEPQRMDPESAFPKWFYTPVSVSVYLSVSNLKLEDQRIFPPQGDGNSDFIDDVGVNIVQPPEKFSGKCS